MNYRTTEVQNHLSQQVQLLSENKTNHANKNKKLFNYLFDFSCKKYYDIKLRNKDSTLNF
jgi:hypothetical protein